MTGATPEQVGQSRGHARGKGAGLLSVRDSTAPPRLVEEVVGQALGYRPGSVFTGVNARLIIQALRTALASEDGPAIAEGLGMEVAATDEWRRADLDAHLGPLYRLPTQEP